MPETRPMTAPSIFKHCVQAIKNGSLIERVSATDKEFHFQNWFKLRALKRHSSTLKPGGRNSYPDFERWRPRTALR